MEQNEIISSEFCKLGLLIQRIKDMEKSNQELALMIFQAMNSRTFDGVIDYFDDSLILDFPGSGRIQGKRKVVVFLKALLRKYPVLCFNVFEVLVDGDQVAALWTNKGNNLAGEDYQNSGVSIIHIDAGKITFISDYFKDTSFT